MVVPFQEQIISELLSDPSGGLVILSSGLSLSKLLSSLLLLHTSPSPRPLLVLSSSPSLRNSISKPNPKPNSKPDSEPNSEPDFPAEASESEPNSEPNPNPDFYAEKTTGLDSNPNSKPKSKHNSKPNSGRGRPKGCTGPDSGPSSDPNFLAEITAEVPLNRRLALYASGTVLCVTSRILIVDLLSGRLRPADVAGVVVLDAHSVSDSSTEAFIVRILRTGNPELFVWAFSERPQAMVAGFAKTERIMRSLYLRKLHLWPRFQVYVSQDLERDPPEVVDVRVPISPHMKVIQKAVIEVMDACLKEMRKTNKVDVDDLTVENGLFKSFDEIVRRQLDPIWHTLGKKTKQLVSDLKTLRKLLDYLVKYDAVTYLKYLDSLRAAESFRSVWIFAESSYKIFEYAKKRVYQFKKSDGDELMGKTKALLSTKKRKLRGDHKKEDSLPTTSTSEVVLDEVLEEPPKWKVLREVLQEIEEERQKQVLLRAEQMDGCDEDNGIVLVVCKDEYSCIQLEDCITKGPQKVMREEWEKYLLSKVELRNAPKHNKKKAKGPKGFGVLDGVVPVVHGKKEEVGASNQEQKALLAAAAHIIKHVEKDIVEDDAQPSVGKGKGKRKNGKSTSRDDKSDNEALVNANTEMLMSEIGARRTKDGAFLNRSVLRKHSVGVDATSKDAKLLPPVCFYALESEQNILDTLKPSTVVVYHPDMAFVREIEIYKAENPTKQLKVYFLFYEESTEVQKFESSIRRENGAFESLIRQKSLMMIPVDQDGRCLGPSSSIDPQPSTLQNSMTRKAGGRKEAEKETRIIVDMREFMSSLPNVLHQKGMRIIPVTLEVGDYILSPLICVERKSIQDLFGSFASGRLFNQVEMMSRYYRIPVLLIEFSQDKSFSFLSASDIGDDVTPNSIISKLSLLVLHFPRLRIVWSRSLHATAEIFATLKANQDEPDEVKAIRVGVPSEEGIVENDVRAENYNTSAVEFLRRLPGVTDSNYRSLMDNCESLADLALLPLEKLAELMGGQKSAQTLRDFLDAKYPTLL